MKYIVLIILALSLVCASHGLIQRRVNREVAKGDECPTICPYLFAPICGFDGNCYRKFGNKCEFDVSNCSGGAFEEVRSLECDKSDVIMCPIN